MLLWSLSREETWFQKFKDRSLYLYKFVTIQSCGSGWNDRVSLNGWLLSHGFESWWYINQWLIQRLGVSLSWVRIWISGRKCFALARLRRTWIWFKLWTRSASAYVEEEWSKLLLVVGKLNEEPGFDPQLPPNFINIGSKLVFRQKRIFFVQFEWKKAERKRRRRKLSLDNVWGNR